MPIWGGKWFEIQVRGWERGHGGKIYWLLQLCIISLLYYHTACSLHWRAKLCNFHQIASFSNVSFSVYSEARGTSDCYSGKVFLRSNKHSFMTCLWFFLIIQWASITFIIERKKKKKTPKTFVKPQYISRLSPFPILTTPGFLCQLSVQEATDYGRTVVYPT